MIITILIILAIVIIGILATPLKLKFSLNKSEKKISISYLLLSVLLDIDSRSGRILLARLPIRQFSLERSKAIKTEKKREVEPAKRAKASGYWLRQLKSSWKMLKIAGALLRKFRTRDLVITISGGLDPYLTGNLFGFYMALRGMAPGVMSHVDFRPDFSAESLQFEGKGVIYIRTYYLLYTAIRLAIEIIRLRLGERSALKKKGVRYAQ
jgi:hypothetical protein